MTIPEPRNFTWWLRRIRINGFNDKVEKLKHSGIGSIEKVFPDATIKSF